MPFISLITRLLTQAASINQVSFTAAQVDYIEAGYESANLSSLLDQIFIYQTVKDVFVQCIVQISTRISSLGFLMHLEVIIMALP